MSPWSLTVANLLRGTIKKPYRTFMDPFKGALRDLRRDTPSPCSQQLLWQALMVPNGFRISELG